MPTVVFTSNLQRHVECLPQTVAGRTVGECLEHVFAQNERTRGYVLDDQGAVRKHMMIFVDGRAIGDRETLGDAVSENGEIYVMQALSGG